MRGIEPEKSRLNNLHIDCEGNTVHALICNDNLNGACRGIERGENVNLIALADSAGGSAAEPGDKGRLAIDGDAYVAGLGREFPGFELGRAASNRSRKAAYWSVRDWFRIYRSTCSVRFPGARRRFRPR